ncbi:MAG: hypothetical protein WCQ99_03625 [Pseudomonadota bacterium]
MRLQTELVPDFLALGDFELYRQIRHERPGNTKLFETIYNCEFLGFIDTLQKRVGCLLHPAVTGGKDLRDHCFYGVEICSGHFCPGYSCLTTPEQRAVVQSIDDWYLYGLVITDIDLVKEFFKLVENTIGDSIKEKKLTNPHISSSLLEFFRLKEDWKFKARENRLGKYYFSQAEYAISRIEYEQTWGVSKSRFDKILVSLESEFTSKDDLFEAEEILENKINNFIAAYSNA